MIQYSYKHILRVQVITRFRLTYIAHSQTKSEYAYTTGTPGEPLSTVNYAYGNSDWKDLLTEYNGTAINYDLSGNPLNWRNANALTWNGRRLAGMTLADGTELAFEYNADGLRTSKTVGNSTVQYVWNDGNLVAEIRDGYTLKFCYNNGEIAGFSYNGTDYYYGKDSFGVIRYLYNTSGEVVTTYTYDAWGTVLSVTGTLAETVGTVNPVRYKSYYLDSETGWYYLQSRYYDPVVGRFLNADEVIYAGVNYDFSSNNLFAYCGNNSVIMVDSSGRFGTPIQWVLSILFGIIGWSIGDYLALKIVKKKNWKYWAFRSAIAVGGAAIGSFAGSLITTYVGKYLSANPGQLFRFIDKVSPRIVYRILSFLGVNPFDLVNDRSRFIGILKRFNDKSVVITSYEWIVELCQKANQLGYRIMLHPEHEEYGYTWHLHILDGTKKLNYIHVQVTKVIYELLQRLFG